MTHALCWSLFLTSVISHYIGEKQCVDPLIVADWETKRLTFNSIMMDVQIIFKAKDYRGTLQTISFRMKDMISQHVMYREIKYS